MMTDKDKKEIANRLRNLQEYLYSSDIAEIIDILDPSKPGPKEPVWFRTPGSTEWLIGVVSFNGQSIHGPHGWIDWPHIEWKPARFLGPWQEAVDVPRVSRWRDSADAIWLEWHDQTDEVCQPGVEITRAEANRMEAENES
jgi:hypothetical protein